MLPCLLTLFGLLLQETGLTVFFLPSKGFHRLLHLPLLFKLKESRQTIVVVLLINIQTYLKSSGLLEDVLIVTLEFPAKR